jgi:signal transduction histidine kinase
MLKQLAILSALLLPIYGQAERQAHYKDRVLDSLNRALHSQKDAQERMCTALNIRDYAAGHYLLIEKDYLDRLHELYILARDAKNETIKMEAIRRMYNMYIGFGCKKTQEAELYKKLLDEMPNGYLKRASLSAMEISKMILEYETTPVQELNSSAKQQLTDYFTGRYRALPPYQKITAYSKILLTFNRINASMIPVELLKEYEEMAMNVPSTFVFLRGRMFYLLGLSYQERRDARSAFHADSLCIDNMHMTETIYKNSGRVYRTMNTYSYLFFKYRFKNLAYNGESLPRGERRRLAAETYKKLIEYASKSKHLTNYLRNEPAIEAYYDIAMEKWNLAEPLIDKLLETHPNSVFLAEQKMKIARMQGDKEAYERARSLYQENLETDKEVSFNCLKEEADIFAGIARNIYSLYEENETITKENSSLLRDKRNIYTVLILGLVLGVVYLFYSLTKITLQRRKLELDAKAKEEMLEKIENDAKEKLELSTKLVEEARLKNSILANMNHEIRTPLNAINGFTEILVKGEEEGIPYTPEERQEFYNIIHTSSERLLSVVSDIIDLSKLETNDFFFNNHNHKVNEILQERFDAYCEKNDKPEVEVCLEKAEEDVVIFADKARIEQIINNIMDNALRFTHTGSVTLGCNVDSEKKEVSIYVKDTGIGISEDKLDAVFHRFVKSDDNSPGTGLGLAICKGLTERMGGRIVLQSTLNVGSTFTVTFPYVEHPEETKA